MATNYSDVYDFFMLQIKDYNLNELYDASTTDFENFLQGFLREAIVEFNRICDQDLTDRNDTTGVFNIDLTERNVVTLARGMVKFWLEKEVQDVMDMGLHLTDRDFKHYSEAQNLQSKRGFLQDVTERVAQMYVDYGFDNVDWTAWGDGDFGV